MRTYEQQLNYERLELIPSTQSQLQINLARVVSVFQTGWKKLVTFFAPGSEPHVYQTSNELGDWWYVYDPMTGKSIWFATKSEVLEWLDDRYYRQGRLLD